MTTTEWCKAAVVIEERPTGQWEVRVRFLYKKADGSEAAQGSLVLCVHARKEDAEHSHREMLKWLTNYTHLTVSSARSGNLENEPLFPKKATPDGAK